MKHSQSRTGSESSDPYLPMSVPEFTEMLTAAMAEAEEAKTPLSVAITDIDSFIRVNDEFGMAAGDAVLELLAHHLAEGLPSGGRVIRHGGDHFAILLPGLEKEEAFLWLEEKRKTFDREHVLEAEGRECRCSLTISGAIASYPADGTRADEVIRKVHDAIYRAKVGGRNRVCLARDERMVTKTSHYTQGQLERLAALAKRENLGEAALLREALDDLLRKYDK